MNIALVHDHLISDGGGERVLQAFSEVWPQAPIFTLVYDRRKTNSVFVDKNIHTSYLQYLPLSRLRYQWYLPLRPRVIENMSFNEFDIVLSNSASLVKGIHTSKKTLHINYCHTPTRFLWVDKHERLDPLERVWPISALSDWYKRSYLQQWDINASHRVDTFIANSLNVKERIKNIYQRDAAVVYPPVNTRPSLLATQRDNYFLAGGRLVSYKRFDVVIRAFNRLDMPLVIFGSGPDYRRLRSLAGSRIIFAGHVSEEQKQALYAHAQAYIHPQIEDFGITAVESMASGTPVIAYRAGGAFETVQEGVTGVFFNNQDWESLGDTVIRFDARKFNPPAMQQHAQQFSVDRFKKEIKGFVEKEWEDFKLK